MRRQRLADRRVVERALHREAVALRTGDWGPWQQRTVAPGEIGSGWTAQVHTVYWNAMFAVLVRDVATPWGQVTHLAMRNTSAIEIPWSHKQRIKSELFGADRVAVEVFPAEAELVDAANMYHLWVLPAGFALPFGIAT